MSNSIQQRVRRLLALDSSALSDAMDGLMLPGDRVLTGLVPRGSSAKLAGPAFTVTYEPTTPGKKFEQAGTYIDDVPMGHVVVIDSQGRTDCTNWGDLLTRLALRNGLGGTIVNGAVRDIQDIKALGYPLYSVGLNAVSGKNRTRMIATGRPIEISGVTVNPGDWLFGDENAVLVLPAEKIDAILEHAECVSLTEERIAEAIQGGMALKRARIKYGYTKPWNAQNGQ